MPLGNLTSQFFANIYLNELDQFVKHHLKAECYIRYVDDFVILHRSHVVLEIYKTKITGFLKTIHLELHPDKSKICPLEKGAVFLGYKIFCYHKILKKSNLWKFQRKMAEQISMALQDNQFYDPLLDSLHGWLEYARWGDTYKLRKRVLNHIRATFGNRIADRNIDRWLKCKERA